MFCFACTKKRKQKKKKICACISKSYEPFSVNNPSYNRKQIAKYLTSENHFNSSLPHAGCLRASKSFPNHDPLAHLSLHTSTEHSERDLNYSWRSNSDMSPKVLVSNEMLLSWPSPVFFPLLNVHC